MSTIKDTVNYLIQTNETNSFYLDKLLEYTLKLIKQKKFKNCKIYAKFLR